MSVLKRLLELPAANQSQIGHTSSRVIGHWPCCVLSFRQHRNPCSSESAPAFCLAWQRFPRWWKVWPNSVHNIFPNNILTSFPRKGRGKSTQLRQVSKTTSQVAHGTSEMSKQRCVSGSPYPAYLWHQTFKSPPLGHPWHLRADCPPLRLAETRPLRELSEGFSGKIRWDGDGQLGLSKNKS